MTIVKSFTLPGNITAYGNVALKNAASHGNRTSVLVGINGTHKSRILRGLIDDALEVSGEQRSLLSPNLSTVFKTMPEKVIALSAIPSDRFPNKVLSGFNRINKYDVERYEYIGPRQGTNLVSRNQSVETLVLSALTQKPQSDNTYRFIERICKKAGISTKFRIRLEFAASAKIKEGLLIKWHDPGKGRANKPVDFRRYELDIPEEHKMAAQSLLINRKLLDEQNGIEIDLSEPNQILDCSQAAIAAALRAGLFRIRPLEFPSIFTSELSNINDFSAGQWGLFSSLPAVALQCVDRTLLLVDEPESALHPGWQRTYIEDLTEAISHRKECHVFIATHSPLIVGSLGTKLTDLISLKKNTNDGSLTASLLTSPTGWEVDDVLQEVFELASTRAPQLVKAMDEILGLIAGGTEKNKLKIITALKGVRPLIDGLPDDDVLRGIVSSASRLVGENSK